MTRFPVITEAALAELRQRIGRPVRRPEPYIEVATRDAVRHWAHGIGDRNPHWLAHGVAPPTILLAMDRIVSHEDKVFTKRGCFSDFVFPEIASLKMKKGSIQSFKERSHVLLSNSFAYTMFGDADPAVSAVNLTPSTTELVSPASITAGVASSKIDARGVTADDAADCAPVPAALVAATRNV